MPLPFVLQIKSIKRNLGKVHKFSYDIYPLTQIIIFGRERGFNKMI